MFHTPEIKGGAANLFSGPHKSPQKTIALNGLFTDGIWKCNCEPRLPASHFQVKKEGRNQGRWFYTCQQTQDSRCRFFLWDDDAVGREMRAVVNNSRTETDPLRPPADAAGERKAVGSSSSKRWTQLRANVDDHNKLRDFPLSAENLEEVATKIDEPKPQPVPYPETPRKVIKTDHFITPGSKRKLEEQSLPTPVTGGGINDEDVFTTSTGTSKEHMWDGNERFALRSPSATPTPSRFGDVTEVRSLAEGKIKNGHNITEEVMELLKDQQIDEDTSAKLRQLLERYAMKFLGTEKGRDITRVALKAKISKVAELQQKITALETEREMDKTVIRHFKSDMAHSLASKRGRSRGRRNS